MLLQLLPNGDISLINIHPLEANALLAIPMNADATGTPEAEARLFPSPVDESSYAAHDPLEVAATQEDWEEFVVPELRELFDGGLARVMENLKKLTPAPYEEFDEEDEESYDDDEDAEDEEFLNDLMEQTQNVEEKGKPTTTPDPSHATLDSTDETPEAQPKANPIPNYKLTIPRALAEDWFRAMNQARLVMVEKTLWIDDRGEVHGPFLSQVHYEIYTNFQGWLIEMVLSEN
jgi:hypothetical protein